VDDYIDLCPESALGFKNRAPFTIEFWLSTTSTKESYIIGSQNTNKGWAIYMIDGKLWFKMKGISYTSTELECYSNKTINDGAWHHCAISYTGPNLIYNHTNFYIDGADTETVIDKNDYAKLNTFGYIATGGEVYIGKMPTTNNYFLEGAVDELRIWNKKLDQQTIQANMYREIGAENGLIACYNFNQNKEAILNSVAGHSGTLHNIDDSQWIESYAMVTPIPTGTTWPARNGFNATWSAPNTQLVDSVECTQNRKRDGILY